MATAIELPEIDLIEPVPAPLIYVDGVGIAAIRKGLVELVFYVDQTSAERMIEHHIVARIAIPIDPLQNNMSLIARAVLTELRGRLDDRATVLPEPEERFVM